ncbi:MAG: ComEC/Rec2 family competence protein [Opitutales bacterium]|nr:ComEC/Rec2 family competence protein [Opitutales bacterium]
MTTQEKIRHQAPLAKYAAALAAGIALSRVAPECKFALSIAALAAAAAACRAFAKKSPRIPALIAFLFFGIFYAQARAPIMPYPQFTAREARLELRVKNAAKSAKGGYGGMAKIESASENFELARGMDIWFYAKNIEPIFRGERLEGVFIVREAEKDGGFYEYLKNRNALFKAYAAEGIKVSPAGFPCSFYSKARAFMEQKLEIAPRGPCLVADGGRALKAMFLGDKSALSREEKDGFKLTGTMHIFAISGLHVGMLAAIIYAVLALARLPAKIKPAISLPILFLYVNACGAPPSAMRAFIMIAAVWIACAFARKPKPFAGLAAAFMISLLINPGSLFDAGFALSYAVVAAIVLYAADLNEFLLRKIESGRGFELKEPNIFRRIFLKCEGWIVAGLCIAVAALAASAPLCSYYFGYVPLLSVFYSIPFVLGATIAVFCASASVVLPAFLCPATNAAGAFILEIMLRSAEFGASYGFVLNAKIAPEAAALAEAAIVAAMLFCARIKSPLRWLVPPAISALAISTAFIF